MNKCTLKSKVSEEKLTELGNSHWTVQWPETPSPTPRNQSALGQFLIRNFAKTSGHCLSRNDRVVWVGRKWDTIFVSEWVSSMSSKAFFPCGLSHYLEYLQNVRVVVFGTRRCPTGCVVSLYLRTGEERIKADRWRLCCIYSVSLWASK